MYGYYGNGQWMAAQQQDALKQLNVYGKDLEKARALIQQAGYAADSNGKFVNLSFKLAVPAENAAAQALIAQLQESFDSLGVGLEVTELPMDELLKHLSRQTERTYDMFFLGLQLRLHFRPVLHLPYGRRLPGRGELHRPEGYAAHGAGPEAARNAPGTAGSV